MIKKDNFINDSTANIFDSLKEEELPDALLSPDSFVRKKRDIQRFNDLLCAVFIEAMKIRNLMMAHFEVLIKKAIQKFDLERESFQDKLTNLKLMIIQQKQLSSQQLAQLVAIKAWFRHVIEKIDDKISLLEQRIQRQNTHIQELQQSRKEACTSLIQVWHEQVNRLPASAILSITLNLIPPYLIKGKEVRSFITFDSNEQKNLLTQLGENLENIISLGLNAVILEKILPHAKQKLNEAWSFLPLYERESAIDRCLKKSDTQIMLTQHVVALLCHSPLLKNKISELHALDLDLAQIMAETEINISYRDALAHEKALVKEGLSQFDPAFLPFKMLNNENQGESKRVESIMNYKNALNHSLVVEGEVFSQMLSSIENFSQEAENLLAEIDHHFDEIIQTDNLEQLQNLEKKGSDIATTVEEFILNKEMQEEPVFEINNQPKYIK